MEIFLQKRIAWKWVVVALPILLAPFFFRTADAQLPGCQGCVTNEFGEYYTMIGSFEGSGEVWDGGTANPGLKRHGGQAWTLTSTNGVDSMTTRTFDVPLDLTKFVTGGNYPSDGNDFIDLWGYQHDMNLSAGSFHLDASPAGQEWTDYFTFDTLGENKVGWRYLHFTKDTATTTGNPNWNNIKRARISIRSMANATSSFTFDLWRHVSADTMFPPTNARQGVNIRCQGGVAIRDAVAKAKQLKAEWVRAPFIWSALEPSSGTYNATTSCEGQSYDELVDAVADEGLTLVALIYGTPGWASSGKGCAGAQSCPPNDPNSIKPVLSFLKNRYGSDIRYWEIWNEPNSCGFWYDPSWYPSPSCEGIGMDETMGAQQFVSLLRAAYEQIKQQSSGDTVISGGIYDNGEMPIKWMDKFYQEGGGSYANVIAFHPYTSQMSPNYSIQMSPWNLRGHARGMRAIMSVYGDQIGNKELWATEFGFSTGSAGVSETTQGNWDVDGYNIVSNNQHAQSMFIYELVEQATGNSHEDGFGLLHINLTPKNSFNIVKNRFQ